MVLPSVAGTRALVGGTRTGAPTATSRLLGAGTTTPGGHPRAAGRPGRPGPVEPARGSHCAAGTASASTTRRVRRRRTSLAARRTYSRSNAPGARCASSGRGSCGATSDHAERLLDLVHVHARGRLLGAPALEELADPARELDALERAGDRAGRVGRVGRVGEHLAVLGAHRRRDLVTVLDEELVEGEAGSPRGATRSSPATPGTRRGPRRPRRRRRRRRRAPRAR